MTEIINCADDELYMSIRASLMRQLRLETPEENLFIHEITLEATAGAREYMKELEEAIVNLQETVKRLSKIDTRPADS